MNICWLLYVNKTYTDRRIKSLFGLLGKIKVESSRWIFPEEGRVDGDDAHPAGNHHHRQRAIGVKTLREERRGGEPPRRGTTCGEEPRGSTSQRRKIIATTGGVVVGAAPSPSTASRSSSALGPSMAPTSSGPPTTRGTLDTTPRRLARLLG